jgi:hypothetical protein
MLKQIQTSITQGAGVTSTELTLGTSANIIITQCTIQSLGTGIVALIAGPSSSTKICFSASINNTFVSPISTYLSPVHNLTNVVTIKSSGFTAGDIINVVINYREFNGINSLSSNILLENYAASTNIIGATPLLANSESNFNYNLKSFFVTTASTTNQIVLKLTSPVFTSGILLLQPFIGQFNYQVMGLTEQTLLTIGSSISVEMSEAKNSSFFISYTKVPA